MENTRKDSGDRQDKLRQQLERAQENSKSASRELRDLKHRAQAAREERDTLNAEQQQLLKEKSKLELTIKVGSILHRLVIYRKILTYLYSILGSE